MKNLFLVLFLCWFSQAGAQVSVYDCINFPHITQPDISNAGTEFHRPCIQLDDNFNFSGTSSKTVTSSTSIDIKSGFDAGNYSGNGGMDLKINPKSDFDVAVMNYPSLSNILKLKRFELGVGLPPSILQKVNNFVNNVPVGNNEKINPYLEWELRVVAEFQYIGLPSETTSVIVVDGFYTREFTSEMQDPLPPANNSLNGVPYYDGAQYATLGSWTQIPTDYPFRIRFAPPLFGEWKCVVKIYSGTDIYIAEEFIFRTIESGSPGYIYTGDGDRYLAQNGKSFFPVGCNMPWPETSKAVDPELDQYMKKEEGGQLFPLPEGYRREYIVPRVYEKYKGVMNSLIDNGANYFRTIMYPSGTDIEWEKLGNYTQRLHMAQEMDEILELAESRNAYLHWNLQIHFSFQKSQAAYGKAWTWDWDSNDNEDFCYKVLTESDDPVVFFTHAESKKYYKQRLRYILARYGYSTNIAIFELFSEISNVGNNVADESTFYQTGTNWEQYRDWQVEMASYIKSQYNGKIHLLTASYAGEKHVNDNTFMSDDIRVSTSNLYDFKQSDFAGFWDRSATGRCISDNADPYYNSYNFHFNPEEPSLRKYKPQPMIFSETGPVQLENACEGSNLIETNRSMWQGMFSGLAGALNWNAWYYPSNFAIFGQMSNFISNLELNGDDWHPGADMRDDLPEWNHSGLFGDEMQGERADLAYLRSGDGNYAIGVLTNKTFNGKNYNNCIDEDLWAFEEEDKKKFPEDVNTDNEGLRLRDMHASRYYVNYFLPTDLSTPIHSTDDLGPRVKLSINIAPSKETYIVLFMARRQNHQWSSIAPDTLTFEEIISDSEIWHDAKFETVSLSETDDETIRIRVFPVPSSHFVTIEAEQHMGKVEVIMEAVDGKTVKQFFMQNEREHLDVSQLNSGTYILKFIVAGNNIVNRRIVKI